MREGRIIKSLAGFYYVEENGITYTCKARGKFRKSRLKPVVGDYCTFELDDNDEGYILQIKKRRNILERPPIANIDQALLVFSITEPDFDQLLLDRFLTMVENLDITPIIVVTKIDLDDSKINYIKETYHSYKVIFIIQGFCPLHLSILYVSIKRKTIKEIATD